MRKTDHVVIRMGAANFTLQTQGSTTPLERKDKYKLANALCDAMGLARPKFKRKKHKHEGKHKGESQHAAQHNGNRPPTGTPPAGDGVKRRRRPRRSPRPVPAPGPANP